MLNLIKNYWKNTCWIWETSNTEKTIAGIIKATDELREIEQQLHSITLTKDAEIIEGTFI